MTDTATLVLDVDARKLLDAERAQDRFGRSSEKMETQTTNATAAIGSVFARLVPLIGAAVASLGAGMGLAASIREAEKFETTMFRIDAVIKATGGAAGRSADQLREQARELARSTLESTEGVLQAQQTLLTFRNVQGDVFDRAIVAAADMTAALGGDLNSATMQLAKALENPLEGISALSRSGTVFTSAQKDMVRAMVETGQIAEAQNFILSELEAQYSGTAHAAAGGLAGAQDTLGQSLQELGLVIGTALLPPMTAIAYIAADVVDGFAAVISSVVSFFDAIGGLGLWMSNAELARVATDNLTLSMGDEITAINELAAAMGSENTMTIAFARDKLTQAQAHLATADAVRQETQSLVDNQVALLELERVRRMDALSVIPNASEAYELMDQSIADLIVRQQGLREIVEETNGNYRDAVSVVEDISAAILDAEDGVVTFGSGVVTATGLTDRLSTAASEISFSGAVSEAQQLAQWLSISMVRAIELSTKTAAMRDEDALMAGNVIPSADDKANLKNSIENYKRLTDTVKVTRRSIDRVSTSAGGAARSIRDMNDDLRKTADAMNLAADPMLAYTKRLSEIEELKPHLTAKGYSAAMKDVNKQLVESNPLVNDLTDAFSDFAVRGFQDFKGFAQSVLSIFKNMIRDMIAYALKNRIMVMLGLGGSSVGSSAMAAVGSAASSAGGGLLGSFGGGAGLAGLAGGTGLMGGLGNALGGGVGNVLSIGANAAAAGGGLMATLGAAIPLVGALGLAFGALRTKTTELDRGVNVAVNGINATVENFSTVQKSRFFGLSKSTSTVTSEDENSPILDAVRDIQGGVREAASLLGIGADAFQNFSHSFSLSLKGMTDEQAASAIAAELAKMGDAYAGMIPHIKDMNQLLAVSSERFSLETRVLQLQGDTVALRERELDAVHEYNRATVQQIHDLEDAADAADKASRVASERFGIETRILQLKGDTNELQRRELAALDQSNRARMRELYQLERAASVNNERFGLETRLLELQGKTGALRKRELEALHPLNRALQREIYAAQDAAKAIESKNDAIQKTMDIFRQPLSLDSDRFTDRFSATIQAAEDRRARVMEATADQTLSEIRLMRIALNKLHIEQRDANLVLGAA